MEGGRKLFVLIGRGYEIFLIPREGVRNFSRLIEIFLMLQIIFIEKF